MIWLNGFGMLASLFIAGQNFRCNDGSLSCELIDYGCLNTQSCFEMIDSGYSRVSLESRRPGVSVKVDQLFTSGFDSLLLRNECVDPWVISSLIRGANRYPRENLAFEESLIALADRIDMFDVKNPQLSIGIAWYLVREKNNLWYEEIRKHLGGEEISIGGCIYRYGDSSARCSLSNRIIDSLEQWFPGLDFRFKSIGDSSLRKSMIKKFYRQAYAFPEGNSVPETHCRTSAVRKSNLVDSAHIEELGEKCLKWRRVSACKELARLSRLSSDRVDLNRLSSLASKAAFIPSTLVIDSLIRSQFGFRELVFVQDIQYFVKIIEIICPEKLGYALRRLDSLTLILVDGRHWLPRAEMNMRFALWFYGSTWSSPGVELQNSINQMSNLSFQKQRECLNGNLQSDCGLIKQFIASVGANENVNNYSDDEFYLVRPLGNKVPDWPIGRTLE